LNSIFGIGAIFKRMLEYIIPNLLKATIHRQNWRLYLKQFGAKSLIIICFCFGFRNIIMSFGRDGKRKERIRLQEQHDAHNAVLRNMLKEIISQYEHLFFVFYIFLLCFLKLNLRSVFLFVLLLQFGDDLFRLLRFLNQIFNDRDRVVNILHDAYDLCGAFRIVLTELMNNPNVFPIQRLVFFT
jgi:hypothetical protein